MSYYYQITTSAEGPQRFSRLQELHPSGGEELW